MQDDRIQAPMAEAACDPRFWPLEPGITYLNHGSFGSCPVSVLEFQKEIQMRMERQPIDFFVRDLEGLLDEARGTLGEFIGTPADDLVFVPNATTGVNTVLRSLRFGPGDELLVTDQEYNACRNALNFVAAQSGASVKVASVPFPLASKDDVVAAVMEAVTPATRLVMLDHVSSQTGMVMPLERLVPVLNSRGILTLVDGAHAPGMIPLHLPSLMPTFYTGNCHKWICAPKGAAFLYVNPEQQEHIHPLTISHGANSPRTDRSRLQIEFAWTGTSDPSACLSIPEALRVVGQLLPDGWPEIMRRNRQLALAGREQLCRMLKIQPPCPDEMIGSMASVPLPDSKNPQVPKSPLYLDPLQDWLIQEYRIEVPIIPWPAQPKRLLRISAQLYNSLPQYERLVQALSESL